MESEAEEQAESPGDYEDDEILDLSAFIPDDAQRWEVWRRQKLIDNPFCIPSNLQNDKEDRQEAMTLQIKKYQFQEQLHKKHCLDNPQYEYLFVKDRNKWENECRARQHRSNKLRGLWDDDDTRRLAFCQSPPSRPPLTPPTQSSTVFTLSPHLLCTLFKICVIFLTCYNWQRQGRRLRLPPDTRLTTFYVHGHMMMGTIGTNMYQIPTAQL